MTVKIQKKLKNNVFIESLVNQTEIYSLAEIIIQRMTKNLSRKRILSEK